MVLEVYCDPCTVNSRKVLAALDYLGTKYNFHHVNYFIGEHKSPEYMKINPNATVPAAVDGDLHLTESNSILLYIAEGNEEAYPSDRKLRAQVNTWLLWEASCWFQSCYVYLVEYVVKPLLKAEPDPAVIDAESERFNRLAGILDTQLSKTKYLVGDQITIADFAVAAPAHLHAAQKLPLDKYPNLKRWLADMDKVSSWQKTQGAVDKALLPGKPVINGTGSTKGVKANFNYTKDADPKLTEIYFYETDAAKDTHDPGDDPHEMTVMDGWHRADSFSTEKEGFALGNFHTGFEEWENEDAVRSQFYPEVVDFLKKTTGATRVLVFDHTIRTQKNQAKKLTQETNTSQRAPVMLVHCDYTAESGPLRVRQLLPDEADDLLSRRVAFYNVWKPLHNIVEERPLAMCDVTSSPSSDFFKLHLRYRDRNGENYVMRHSPSHKWWYFPKITPEHVILLKTYESDTSGRARFVGHSAFEDPTSPPNAPIRESIEIRTIAFF
ncbi:hypothetical protein B0A52_01002 [Exophiala mesophila]|uniref:Glutathione S-transferase n=1 Tax=Exophiala mesophila TaxID=212818 RepID=A0A438NG71_EXOME|nr:hypothetical protein B0A52_01002 [Exophiala mesophila]